MLAALRRVVLGFVFELLVQRVMEYGRDRLRRSWSKPRGRRRGARHLPRQATSPPVSGPRPRPSPRRLLR